MKLEQIVIATRCLRLIVVCSNEFNRHFMAAAKWFLFSGHNTVLQGLSAYLIRFDGLNGHLENIREVLFR